MLCKSWLKSVLSFLFILGGSLSSSTNILALTLSEDERQQQIVLVDAVNILARHFSSEVAIESVTQLSKPERKSLILRVNIQSSNDKVPKSLILKQVRSRKLSGNEEWTGSEDVLERFSREWAGLEFLNSLKIETKYIPSFYGASVLHYFVLTENLEEIQTSLVNSLTGSNVSEALAALNIFVRRLGQLHADSHHKVSAFFEILHRISTRSHLGTDAEIFLYKFKPKLQSFLRKFTIDETESLYSEFNTVLISLLESGPFTAYTHGDVCPDNVLYNPSQEKFYFIDFENGSMRNALIDGVFLRMGMPTCWCAKSIPRELLESLEETYRTQLLNKIPEAGDDNLYQTAYTNACAFWMLRVIFDIEKVIDRDFLRGLGPSASVPEGSLWRAEENLIRPRILFRLQTFIEISEKYNRLPHLRFMASQILQTVMDRWPGVTPMGLYPVFEIS